MLFRSDVQLGAMIEVPAAAFVLEEILDRVDFISVGTNDLAQYLLAVDRDNPRVARFYDPYHPAVMRLLAQIAATCSGKGRECAVCGEMAGDYHLTMTLLGLGFRTLSMAPVFIPRVKLILTETTLQECTQQARKALALPTAAQVKEFLKGEARQRVRRYLAEQGLAPDPAG